MAKTKRARLLEEEQAALTDADLELPPVDVELPPVEETPAIEPEIANNAYLGLIQDILKKEWDVVNACDSLIATLSADETVDFDKEAVSAIFKELSDKMTTTVGMATKALSAIDPSQEALLKDGEEAADDAMNMAEKEPAEESLEEGADSPSFAHFNLTLKNKRGKEYQKQDSMLLGSKNFLNLKLDDVRRYFQHYYKDRIVKLEPAGFVNEDFETITKMSNQSPEELFSNKDTSTKYWAAEILWELESLLGNCEESELAEDEVLAFIDTLPEEALKEFCVRAANWFFETDWIWEEINDCTRDIIYEIAKQAMKNNEYTEFTEYSVGSENPEEDE